MRKICGILTAGLMLTACQADIESYQYNAGDAQQARAVSECTVVSVRQVKVTSNNNQLGTVIGGAAGGIAGYSIGSGSTAHLLGGLGGAVLGGLAGDAAQGALSSQNAYEYIVKLSNGQLTTITQGSGTLLSPGQRCMLLHGNPARLIAN